MTKHTRSCSKGISSFRPFFLLHIISE